MPTDPLFLTLLFVVGIAFAARLVVRSQILNPESEARLRLRGLIEASQSEGVRTKEREKSLVRRLGDLLARKLERSQMLQGGEGRDVIAWLDLELARAGLAKSVTAFQALGLAIVIWVLGIGFSLLAYFGGMPAWVAAPALLFATAYPPLKLRQKRKARQDEIRSEIMFFYEEISMSLGTGAVSIDEAIRQVTKASERSPRKMVLAEEFAQAHAEYREGNRPINEALRAVTERTGLIEVEGLVDALILGMETGHSGMIQVLDEYASHARETWREYMRTFIASKQPQFTLSVVLTMFGGALLYAGPLILNALTSFAGAGQ